MYNRKQEEGVIFYLFVFLVFFRQADMAGRTTENFDRLRVEVKEVLRLMKNNVEKMLEGKEKLKDLNEKTVILKESSMQFNTRSKQIRRKMCCKHFKLTLILMLVILAVTTVVVIAILFTVKPWGKDSGSGHHNNGSSFTSL